MKGIDSSGAHLVHVPGWMGGWMEVKAVLRIAFSNQKYNDHVKSGHPNSGHIQLLDAVSSSF